MNNTNNITEDNLFIRYYNEEGQHHREDGPAVTTSWGDEYWWINGKLHREGGPAISFNDGRKEWWINGKLHREDGPAIESETTKNWYINGNLHREDGPAVITNSINMWYINNELHRLNNPAIVYQNHKEESWYLFGVYYTRKKYFIIKRIVYKFIKKIRSRLRENTKMNLRSVGLNQDVVNIISEFAY
jgi:hypothetical protein